MIYKTYILWAVCAFSLCIVLSCGHNKDSENHNLETNDNVGNAFSSSQMKAANNGVRSIRVRNIGSLAQVFNDSNYMQLTTAQSLGITPIRDLSNAYFTSRPLVKVASNQYYQIDTLTHSYPYLVPEAAALLEDIGRNFIDSLHSRGGDSYRIKVTSLLRTPASVEKLRKVNVNATDSSTHQYATTFDISYTNFYCLDNSREINQGDLKNLLAEVLLELRKQDRCFVKFENKTACFHITVKK